MKEEPRWHAAIAVVVALVLYMRLPPKLTFGPIWVAPLLVATLLVPLLIFGSRMETRFQRVASIALVATLNFFNVASVVLLVADLVSHDPQRALHALDLLRSGSLIWTTNIIVFALWFWEIDGGGLNARASVQGASENNQADFLFPQMTLQQGKFSFIDRDWKPMFLDYVYLSFTNALAFSPTDVMPLSRLAKMLMLIESLISFVTIALILARSVNIL